MYHTGMHQPSTSCIMYGATRYTIGGLGTAACPVGKFMRDLPSYTGTGGGGSGDAGATAAADAAATCVVAGAGSAEAKKER